MKQIKNVLVVGDSFTCVPHVLKNWAGYPVEHWLHILEQKYDWNVTNLSMAGSGPYNALRAFMDYDYEEFDLCIFAWSEPVRPFHYQVTDLNPHTAHSELYRQFADQNEVYDAAKGYYKHLYYRNLEMIKLMGTMKWFDEFIKEKYPNKLFWHLQCFGADKAEKVNQENLEEQRLYNIFEHGVTFYPSLFYFSVNDPEMRNINDLAKDSRHGHLSNQLHTFIANDMMQLLDGSITPKKKDNKSVWTFKDVCTVDDIKTLDITRCV
tara:strand:- start:1568 stop:2362 length:795 start_codon:yes stop_codon:yes gene_type:complete